MARQVQQLLRLAEVSEPQNFRFELADPRPAVNEVIDYMARVAQRQTVHLGVRVENDVRRWRMDRSAVFTLLKNLIENAIQHSPVGGVVSLTVSATWVPAWVWRSAARLPWRMAGGSAHAGVSRGWRSTW